MIRAVAALIVLAIVVCALVAADRDKPFLVDAHSPGRWDFHNVDYPLCVRVVPPPLVPVRRDPFHPQASEKV